MFIFICGCGVPRTAFYKPNTTLEQSYQDCKECMYDVNKALGPKYELFGQCMGVRGYSGQEFFVEKELPNDLKQLRYQQIDQYGFIYAFGR